VEPCLSQREQCIDSIDCSKNHVSFRRTLHLKLLTFRQLLPPEDDIYFFSLSFGCSWSCRGRIGVHILVCSPSRHDFCPSKSKHMFCLWSTIDHLNTHARSFRPTLLFNAGCVSMRSAMDFLSLCQRSLLSLALLTTHIHSPHLRLRQGISQTLIITRVALSRFSKSPSFATTLHALTTDVDCVADPSSSTP
jgi:hypothetical protein